MTIFFYATRETIDLMRRVVDKLDEKNGCISAEDLWDGAQCVPANVSNNPTLARHGIRQMQEFAKVLQSFTRRTQSLHLNVDSLPKEIIHYIMKDAFDCTMPMSLIRLSHISSKIRNTILDSPSLWASIPVSLETPLSIIANIMRRSAAFSLTVTVDIKFHELGSESYYEAGRCKLSPSSFLSKLQAVFEHHQRWKNLKISVDGDVVQLILDHFPRVNLKSLRALRVEGCSGFFQEWEVSSGQTEELHCRILGGFPPSSMATQNLRVCSLSVYSSEWITETAAFLNAASNLHSLTLDWELDSNEEVPEIRLSCLEHLDIRSRYHCLYGIRPAIPILLKAILCPGLKNLSLEATTYAEYSNLTENMRERYPLLTFFTLGITYQLRTGWDDFFFDDIIRSLPNTIKNIRVKPLHAPVDARIQASRRNDVISYDFCVQYPNLTHLDFEGCHIVQGPSFYAELSGILKKLRVSLNYFQPGMPSVWDWKEQETKNAILTLQRAGVLLNPTS